jgi:hypothetical protein
MSKRESNAGRRRGFCKGLLRGAAAAALGASAAIFAAGAAAAQTPVKDQVPALASMNFAWLALGVDWLDPPPGLGRGPVRQDPAYPYHGNRDGPGQVTPHIGNAKDPVLKPWAAKQMQDSNDEVLTGKRGLPFSAQSFCYPGGVPEQLLTPAQPFYFIQTPEEVWMIWESDHMVRRRPATASSIGSAPRIPRRSTSSNASSCPPTAIRWTSWSRSTTPAPSTNRSTWRDVGAGCRTSAWRWSVPKITAIISAGTCSRSRRPKRPISECRAAPLKAQP